MKNLYLCTSLHYQELVEAFTPEDAKTFMINAHPEDGEYCCYMATDDDKRLFNATPIVPLLPRRKVKLNQLDWVNQLNGARS
jgi:hypothetical protein